MNLRGRRALVTGASRGIGAAIAERLACEGCTVAIAARSAWKPPASIAGSLATTLDRMRAVGGDGAIIRTDLTDEDSTVAMVAAAEAELGGLDILVNNAAVMFPGDFAVTPRQYDLMFDIGVRAPFVATRDASEVMARRGGGAIINISSLAAILPQPDALVYGMTKAALERMSVDAAGLLAEHGIAVNCLRVDLLVSSEGMVTNAGDDDTTDWESPRSIADAVVWMLTQEPSYTGRIESFFDLRRRGLASSTLPSDRWGTGPPTRFAY